MRVPLELTFRDVEKTDEIVTLINEKVAKLDKFANNLISCDVAVERPQRHQNVGNPYRVRIRMRIPPNQEIVIRREPSEGDMHDPLLVVIKDAFHAAERKLREANNRERGVVKLHPAQQPGAYVVRLFRDQGYGFIKTSDGMEYYFHRNSVLNGDFERLEIGTGVRFTAEDGEKGPQASTVQLVDKPGVRATDATPQPGAPPLGWEGRETGT